MANPFTTAQDPNASPIELLAAVRQYQQDWLEHGTDRVHLYFDDVEGDWLEEFDEGDADVF